MEITSREKKSCEHIILPALVGTPSLIRLFLPEEVLFSAEKNKEIEVDHNTHQSATKTCVYFLRCSTIEEHREIKASTTLMRFLMKTHTF